MISDKKLDDVKCFLLDMDGTLFLGNQLIDGAKEFLDKIEAKGLKRIFLTNNSSRNKYYYKEKFAKNNIEVDVKDILTSGEATAIYLSENFQDKKIYLLGSEYLKQDFLDYKLNVVDEKVTPDVVVLASDYDINYTKIFHGCNSITEGAKFIMTHPDINIPIENNKYLPDAGAMGKMIELSTGVAPIIIGKPNKVLVDIIIKKYNVKREELAMVGDLLATDVMLGINADILPILVLTGATSQEKAHEFQPKLKYIFKSVKEIL